MKILLKNLKLILFLFFFILVQFCKKQEQQFSYNQKLEQLTLLKNYKIIKNKKIDDSTNFMLGVNRFCEISGNFNIKRNKKTDWWIVKDRINPNILKIEYIIFGKELFKNQIIFFNKNRIDSLQSKFYTLNQTFPKTITFYFNSPRNKNEKLYKCYFKYFLFDKNKNEIKNDSIIFSDQKGKYFAKINIDKFSNTHFIQGVFNEATTQKISNKEMKGGLNTIYTFDELNY